jgi:hypothetical protein
MERPSLWRAPRGKVIVVARAKMRAIRACRDGGYEIDAEVREALTEIGEA